MNDFESAIRLVVDHLESESDSTIGFVDGKVLLIELANDLLNYLTTSQTEKRNDLPLIVNIEGLDGVGKSTCLQNLSSLLKQHRIESAQLKTPTEQLLAFRAYFDKQPTSIRRAYYQMCNVHLSYLIEKNRKPSIANDDDNVGNRRSVLLVDRWWSSTFAYGTAEKIKAGDLQYDPNSVVNWPRTILAPDLMFVLCLADDAERGRRVHRRGESTVEEDTLDQDQLFRNNIVKLYLSIDIAQQIDASQEPELVAQQIFEKIQNALFV